MPTQSDHSTGLRAPAVMGDFEPHHDWAKISAEDSEKLYVMLRSRRSLEHRMNFMGAKEFASKWMELSNDIAMLAERLAHETFVIPSLVHVAGEVRESEDDDGDLKRTQFCSRCRAPVAEWFPDLTMMTAQGSEIRVEGEFFFKPGSLIGKHMVPREEESSYHAYLIQGRELEDHEKLCMEIPAGLEDLKFPDPREES